MKNIRTARRLFSATILLFLAMLGLLAQPAVSQAATLTVNSLLDYNDGVWGNGYDTLREAIAHASPGDTINFSVTGTITLLSELLIDKDLTITGPGEANLTISGNNAVRVFRVSDDIIFNLIAVQDVW